MIGGMRSLRWWVAAVGSLMLVACGGGGGGDGGAAGVDLPPVNDPPPVDDGGGSGGSDLGAVTLSWVPPTTNSDGSALDDLAGYRIYYGTDAGDLGTIVPVTNPGLTEYVIDNLAAGTYYFVVRAVDYAGNQSANSNMASKTLP